MLHSTGPTTITWSSWVERNILISFQQLPSIFSATKQIVKTLEGNLNWQPIWKRKQKLIPKLVPCLTSY